MTGISSGYSVALRPYVFVSLILFCFMPVLSRACTGHRQTIADSIPVLEIKWLNGKNIELDGNLLEPVWKKANEVAIRSPWGDTSRVVGGARFFFDDHFLYFAFKIKDSTVNIFTSDDELSVAK